MFDPLDTAVGLRNLRIQGMKVFGSDMRSRCLGNFEAFKLMSTIAE